MEIFTPLGKVEEVEALRKAEADEQYCSLSKIGIFAGRNI